MWNPFRVAAPPPEEDEPMPVQVTRNASWSIGNLRLDWVPGSSYINVTIESSISKCSARLHVRDVLTLQEAIGVAFAEANKLGTSQQGGTGDG